jgi:hypothetical protein
VSLPPDFPELDEVGSTVITTTRVHSIWAARIFYFCINGMEKTTKKLYVRQQVQGIVMVTSSTLSDQDGDLRLHVSRRGHSPTVFRINVLRRIRQQENGHGKIRLET